MDATAPEPAAAAQRPRTDVSVFACLTLGLIGSAAGAVFIHARLAAVPTSPATAWALFLGGLLLTVLACAHLHTRHKRL